MGTKNKIEGSPTPGLQAMGSDTAKQYVSRKTKYPALCQRCHNQFLEFQAGVDHPDNGRVFSCGLMVESLAPIACAHFRPQIAPVIGADTQNAYLMGRSLV